MILVDTNVLSSMMTQYPPSSVLHWINNQDTLKLYISTITIAEIGYGLQIMPDGKRRQHLTDRFHAFVSEGFEQRILNFDEQSAYHYAELMAHRRSIGRPLSIPDGQIASIALMNKCDIATRNIRDFEDCGLQLINPFEAK